MKKRTVLLTGGSRGIGAAIAAHFAAQGHQVVTPRRAQLDLSNADSVREFLKVQEMSFDILVNNAGINILSDLQQVQLQDWESMLQTNLTSPLLLMQGVAVGMKEKGWGRIVNISSIFSLVTKEGRASYTATKSALNGLTRTAAVEWAPHGILVNALCPGYVETEMTHLNNSAEQLQSITSQIPMGRLAAPEEIAQYVGFLCDEKNSYLTGQVIVADGGFTCR